MINIIETERLILRPLTLEDCLLYTSDAADE